jgi:hypothetical protein
MLLAIVVTGNDFLLDAVAGAALALVALLVAQRLVLIPAPAPVTVRVAPRSD